MCKQKAEESKKQDAIDEYENMDIPDLSLAIDIIRSTGTRSWFLMPISTAVSTLHRSRIDSDENS